MKARGGVFHATLHRIESGIEVEGQTIIKKREEDDWNATTALPPVAMDMVKDQHIARLHPKARLGAARSLRYSADIIFENERPFAEVLHAVAIGELDRSHLTQWPNHAGAQLLYVFAFENLLKGIVHAKHPELRDPAMWGVTKEEDKPLKKKRREGLQWLTHDIKELVRLAEIEIPEPYFRLLWLFETKATWRGRYPVSTSVPRTVRLDSEGLPDSRFAGRPGAKVPERRPIRYRLWSVPRYAVEHLQNPGVRLGDDLSGATSRPQTPECRSQAYRIAELMAHILYKCCR